MYKITQYPADSGRPGGLRGGHGSGVSAKLNSFLPFLMSSMKNCSFFRLIGSPACCCGRCSCIRWCWAGDWGQLDDFVGQVVTKRRGNGQGLHLLSGHHPAKGHPAHVLQTGNATRTLPEVHTTITSPWTPTIPRKKNDDKSKRMR